MHWAGTQRTAASKEKQRGCRDGRAAKPSLAYTSSAQSCLVCRRLCRTKQDSWIRRAWDLVREARLMGTSRNNDITA